MIAFHNNLPGLSIVNFTAMKTRLVLLLGIMVAATACSKSVCPNNYSNISGSNTPSKDKANTAAAPARSAGTMDKNGRLVKRNAYHPSTSHSNR